MRISRLPSIRRGGGGWRAAGPLPARRTAGCGGVGSVAGTRCGARTRGSGREDRADRREGLHRLRAVHRRLPGRCHCRRLQIPARGDPGTLHRLRTVRARLPRGLHRVGAAVGLCGFDGGTRERFRAALHRLRALRERLSRGPRRPCSPRRIRNGHHGSDRVRLHRMHRLHTRLSRAASISSASSVPSNNASKPNSNTSGGQRRPGNMPRHAPSDCRDKQANRRPAAPSVSGPPINGNSDLGGETRLRPRDHGPGAPRPGSGPRRGRLGVRLAAARPLPRRARRRRCVRSALPIPAQASRSALCRSQHAGDLPADRHRHSAIGTVLDSRGRRRGRHPARQGTLRRARPQRLQSGDGGLRGSAGGLSAVDDAGSRDHRRDGSRCASVPRRPDPRGHRGQSGLRGVGRCRDSSG